MKINVLAENLNKAVGMASRMVSGKTQLPVLNNLLIRAKKTGLEICGTDLEISLLVEVGAKVEEEGEVLVPAKILAELVSTLPNGVVDLSLEKQTLLLSSGGVRAEISGLSADEFPTIPRFSGKGIKFDIDKFRKKMSQILVAVAKENSRPVLEGIGWYLDKNNLELAATDGYRLSADIFKLKEINVSVPSEIVVPARAISELLRATTEEDKDLLIEIDKEKQQIIFKFQGVEITSRLINGEFPPFKQIIPSDWLTRLIVSKEELLAAVKRAAVFARGNANIVLWEIGQDKFTVSASSTEIGKNVSEIATEMEGEDLKVAFNGRYLIDYLMSVESDKVVFESAGELKPGVFKVEGESLIHIIMPIRQSD